MNAHLNEQQFGELMLGSGNARDRRACRERAMCAALKRKASALRSQASGIGPGKPRSTTRYFGPGKDSRSDSAWRVIILHPHLRWVATAAMVLVVSAAFLLSTASTCAAGEQ